MPPAIAFSRRRIPFPRRSLPPFLRLWGWPIALGVLSASGLLSALVSDAAGDWWAWFALAVPLGVIARGCVRRASPSSPSISPQEQR